MSPNIHDPNFDFPAWQADQNARGFTARPARESCHVERAPFGSTTHVGGLAEFSVDGAVTIRLVETGEIVHVYKPGTWRSVKGVGQGGLVLYFYTPQELAARRVVLTASDDEQEQAAACGPVERRI